MSADESAVVGLAHSPGRVSVRRPLSGAAATFLAWFAGSAVVVLAQPGLDRKEAAAAAAAAGIGAMLTVARLTGDPGRRYFRSVVGAIVAVPLTSTWLVRELTGITYDFRVESIDKQIVLPLVFVLVAPLTLRALPFGAERQGIGEVLAAMRRNLGPLDWIVAAYVALGIPAIALGLLHHAPGTYVAQDLGLVAFFVLMYVAGRAVTVEAARDSAGELVEVLLLLGAAQLVLLGWDPSPLYSYFAAACAAAIAVVLLRPRSARLLSVALAVVLLAADGANVQGGASSTTGVDLALGLGVLGYLLVRLPPLLPRWLLVGGAVTVLAVFVGFTPDGATVRGQYHGSSTSNTARTFEAHQVEAQMHSSTTALLLGGGYGATIDESTAPRVFRRSLIEAGRTISTVPEVHLLEYQFLLEYGLLGAAWLAVFVLGLCWVSLRGLERAVRERDPAYVIYATLPLLALAGAFAASSHLQDNPLVALTLGALVTLLGGAADRRRRPA